MEDDIARMEEDYETNTMDLLGLLAASLGSVATLVPQDKKDFFLSRLQALAQKGVPREILLSLRQHIEELSCIDPPCAATLAAIPLMRILDAGRGVEAALPYFVECMITVTKACAIRDGTAYVEVGSSPGAEGMEPEGTLGADTDLSPNYTSALQLSHKCSGKMVEVVRRIEEVARKMLHTEALNLKVDPDANKTSQLFGRVCFLGLRATMEGTQFVQPSDLELKRKVKTPLTYPCGINEWAIRELTKLQDDLMSHVTAVFGAQYILMYHRRLKRYRVATGIERRDRLGIAPDAEISSEDEDMIHSDNEDVDDYMKSFFVEWDEAGVGVFVALAANPQRRILPVIVSPLHILLTSAPYLEHLLGQEAIQGRYLALRYVSTMLGLIEPYSICMADDIMDKDGATARDTKNDDNLTTSSETFEKVFAVAQLLTATMATTPSEFHRMFAYEVFCTFSMIFAEHNRFKFVTSLVELCPYASVASVIVSSLHHEVIAEYRIIQESGGKLTTDQSAFLNQRLINFICRLIPKMSKDVSRNKEVIVALLNLYRFVALYDRTHGNLLDLEKTKSQFSKETLKSVEEALQKETAGAAPLAEYNLLTFAIEMVAEVLQS